jgi:hypothetical protein
MSREKSAMRIAILAVAAIALAPAPADAQAWLPEAGQGAVTVLFQDMAVRQHLFSDGQSVDAGHIDSHNVMLDLTYSVTDKVAVGISLPYVSARYNGTFRHPGSVLDDGSFHGTWQDFRLSARYGLVAGGTAVTPFAELIVPSHEYDYYGHASPGRKLTELQLGLNVGHVLTKGLPGTFTQIRYSYGFAEQSLGRYHDRSNLDAEFGYFINPRLRVFGLTAMQYTHGGVPLTHQFPGDLCGGANPLPASVLLACPTFMHHDQLARANLIDVGLGTQVSLTRRLDVFGSVVRTVIGENVHALHHGISIGLSWGLGKSGPPVPGLDDESARGLPKCLCEKGKAP